MECGKRLYFVKEASVSEAKVKYVDKERKTFYPRLRLLGMLRSHGEDGRAFLPIVFDFMQGWLGYVRFPLSFSCNSPFRKVWSILYNLVQKKNVLSFCEPLLPEEKAYYETSRRIHRQLSRVGKVEGRVSVGGKSYIVGSMSDDEFLEEAMLPIFLIGRLYVTPHKPREAAKKTGYGESTVWKCNYLLSLFGFLRLTREGYEFRDRRKAKKFLERFAKVREETRKKIEAFVKVKEGYDVKKVSREYGIHSQVVWDWKRRGRRPYSLPEECAQALGIEGELLEKAKAYGVFVKTVEEELFEEELGMG